MFSNDPIGKLILQLQVIRDDVAFLKATGQTVSMTLYPELEANIKRLLLTHRGTFTKHISRVEAAGFIISLVNDVVYIHFPRERNTLTFHYEVKTPQFQWRPVTELATS